MTRLEEPPDLRLLARQQRQMLAEMARMRDDMRVIATMLRLLDERLAHPVRNLLTDA